MNRYEVKCHGIGRTGMQELEVEADKYSVQAAERAAYFYLKDDPSPEAVVTDVSFVRRLPGVKYFMDIPNSLVEDGGFCKSVGLRIIMKTSLRPRAIEVQGIDDCASRYLVEDANAPAKVEGHLVEIVCKQELIDDRGRPSTKGKTIRHWISDWKVIE